MKKGCIITVRIPFFPGTATGRATARLVAIFNHPEPSLTSIIAGFQAASDLENEGPIPDRLKDKILDGDFQNDEILIHKVGK